MTSSQFLFILGTIYLTAYSPIREVEKARSVIGLVLVAIAAYSELTK